ncbi:MAG: YaaR family protein [Clostridiales bacterium]|nr:YaaR family protein [Clostridiales bacterium]
MKIQTIKRSEDGIKSTHDIGVQGNPAYKPQVFKRTLTDLSTQKHREHLQFLSKEIDDQGAKLAAKADIREYEQYRKLIRAFIEEIVSNGYAFTKESSYRSGGRHKYIAVIKTIDEKLDALAKDVLSAQAENIAIAGKIDDIRGLILDMLL